MPATVSSHSSSPAATSEPKPPPPFDFSSFATAAALESLGGDALKAALSERGLKCGGTISQRAERLFLLKSTPIGDLDKKHFGK